MLHRCFLLCALIVCDLGFGAPRNDAVLLTAEVQRQPPQIRLRWPEDPLARSYTIYRKTIEDTSWGNPLAVLGPGTNDWIDNDVLAGVAYEYQVHEQTNNDLSNYGYLYSGIEVPMIESRGKVLLLLESTYGRALAYEIARLEQDLTGDGWNVAHYYVSRTDSPGKIKALIKAEYEADPANVKAVFLFGHVPVPYSGNLNPDLHLNHVGAWPADLFYGDVDGTWTDWTVNSTTAEDLRNHNVPGDGKFDQTFIPSPVELQLKPGQRGRVTHRGRSGAPGMSHPRM